MKMVTMLGALVGATLVATPVMAVTLSAKERARAVTRAPGEPRARSSREATISRHGSRRI